MGFIKNDNLKKKGSYTFRKRVFLSFLILILPVIILQILLFEWVLFPSMKNSAWKKLENSSQTISNAIELASEISIKNHLKGIAVENLAMVQNYWEFYNRGFISSEQMQEELRSRFLEQKIGDSGYIYCLDSFGKVVVHPEQEVEGNDFTHYSFVREQIKRKQGYIEYGWKNPGDETARAKALYMVYFPPLDWIISVSSYRNEFEDLVQMKDLEELTLSLKYGDTGYSFLATLEGDVLIHPHLSEGKNLIVDTSNTRNIFSEIQNNDVGQLEYFWKNRSRSINSITGGETFRTKGL